ncbi:MAG: 50S ribosomal protein L3 [Chloroflexota bacterium]
MKGILGKKIGMTQLYDDKGNVVPVTVIEAGPCYVTQVKSTETDGYNAVQMGFGAIKEARLSRPEAGHIGLLDTSDKHPERKQVPGDVPPVRHLREFRYKSEPELQLGDKVSVDIFDEGDHVDVIGNTKGRGFTGVMKRHGFGGGPITHGQSDRQRSPGSIGATSTPGRVFKGKRMPGRMGNQRVTSQNIRVVRVDSEKNLIAVRGSVPGHKGGIVMIKEARKQ